jgi:hypothetical protein
MDHRTILNIGIVSDGDGIHVATNNGIEPYGTVIPHGHITYDGGILSDVTVASPHGIFIFYW